MQVKTFPEAEIFLQSQIQKEPVQATRGEVWLARSKQFMHLLGNPQNQLKVIHIAGTSGKGSTALLTSTILHSQGFNVGLQISPYVVDLRERIQLNNQMISKDTFVRYLNEIMPAIEQARKTALGSPTYFEILVGLSYYIFAKKQVDYAVMETGLGGAFDATNVVTRSDKICVLTKLGLDHTKILGNTITDIARAKSGIIQKENTVISADQDPAALKIISQTVRQQSGVLLFARQYHEFMNVSVSLQGTTFDFHTQQVRLDKLAISLIGAYQAENASLGLQTLSLIAKREGFAINEAAIRQALTSLSFPGRFEIKRTQDKIIILDGAHNPQKMAAFTQALNQLNPNQKYLFLVAFLQTKDYATILRSLTPLAKAIIITQFQMHSQDWTRVSENPTLVAAACQQIGFPHYRIIADPSAALIAALQQSDNLVITGSFYLIGILHQQLEQLPKKSD